MNIPIHKLSTRCQCVSMVTVRSLARGPLLRNNRSNLLFDFLHRYMRIFALLSLTLFGKCASSHFEATITDNTDSEKQAIFAGDVENSLVSDSLTKLIREEGGLIHNVFKLMRLEIAVLNDVSYRLRSRESTIHDRAHSNRFVDFRQFLGDLRVEISEQIYTIKQARKVWRGTKASTRFCELVDAFRSLAGSHPSIETELANNGDTIAKAIAYLESQKVSQLSRKLKIGDIVGDSPVRLADLEEVRAKLESRSGDIAALLKSVPADLTGPGLEDCSSVSTVPDAEEPSDD